VKLANVETLVLYAIVNMVCAHEQQLMNFDFWGGGKEFIPVSLVDIVSSAMIHVLHLH